MVDLLAVPSLLVSVEGFRRKFSAALPVGDDMSPAGTEIGLTEISPRSNSDPSLKMFTGDGFLDWMPPQTTRPIVNWNFPEDHVYRGMEF